MIEEQDIRNLKEKLMCHQIKEYHVMAAETIDALWVILFSGQLTKEDQHKYRTSEIVRNIRSWLVNNKTPLTIVQKPDGSGSYELAYRNTVEMGNHSGKRGVYYKGKGGKYSWR